MRKMLLRAFINAIKSKIIILKIIVWLSVCLSKVLIDLNVVFIFGFWQAILKILCLFYLNRCANQHLNCPIGNGVP